VAGDDAAPVTDGIPTFRRRIRLVSPRPGVVLGGLEDTAHHIRVRLQFAGGLIESVTGEAVRLPWTTCPGAAAGLASLVGTELTTSLRALRDRYDPSDHCTHFFDLAQLAVGHAARGGTPVSYDAVCDPSGGRIDASLRRNGELVLQWTVEDGTITGPAPFAGVGLREGFLGWCVRNLDDDAAEAAFVLRRAAGISGVAGIRLDDYRTVGSSGLSPGACFTAQAERIQVAWRNVGSQRDYRDGPEGMLEGFDEAVRASS
jgi:hypothetical protein